MLLKELINDEKKIKRALYSSGPFWNYKNSRAISEIKKKATEIILIILFGRSFKATYV